MGYVRHNRIVLGAISLDLFAVLLGGATAMLPVYARDILHVGVEGLGPLRAAASAGAAITAIALAFRPIARRVGPVMFLCVGLFGVATIVFGAVSCTSQDERDTSPNSARLHVVLDYSPTLSDAASC